jgi:hypothetical protein
MRDDQDKTRQAKEIEQDLGKGLSRRAFLDRLKAIGVGFGAAFVFGVNRSEAGVGDALVNLKSTNPVLNGIIEESRQDQAGAPGDGEARVQTAEVYARIGYPRAVYRRVAYPRVVYRRVGYPRVPYARLRVPYARFPYRRIL